MGSRAVGRYSTLWGALVLLGVASARAEAPSAAAASRGLPSRVHLLLPECATPPVDAKLLLELLRTELWDDGVRQVDSGRVEPGQARRPQAYLRATLPCEPEAREVMLRVEDPVSFKAVERPMELADLPPSAKARTLALGLAELLRASWAGLAIMEPPLLAVPEGEPAVGIARPPTPAESSSALVRPEPSRREPLHRSFSMRLGGKALWFVDPGNPVWGGQVQGEYGRWSLGAQLLAGSEPSFAGDISLRLVTGTLGFTVLALSSERIEFRSGVSVAAGRAWVRGPPIDVPVIPQEMIGMSFDEAEPYLAAMLTARSRWWFSSAWAFTVEAEAGRASGIIARVEGQEVASLAGWLGGLSVGVSFAP